LPEGREAERRPDGKGGYFITLLPGESYSNVIIRVARE
jgi:hypothetical protein